MSPARWKVQRQPTLDNVLDMAHRSDQSPQGVTAAQTRQSVPLEAWEPPFTEATLCLTARTRQGQSAHDINNIGQLPGAECDLSITFQTSTLLPTAEPNASQACVPEKQTMLKETPKCTAALLRPHSRTHNQAVKSQSCCVQVETQPACKQAACSPSTQHK